MDLGLMMESCLRPWEFHHKRLWNVVQLLREI